MNALRRIAMKFPEVEEGIACQGTPLECATFKARNKAFLFVSQSEARVKLHDSLAVAARLAAGEPERYQVGAHGWVKVTYAGGRVPLDVMERWIDESYRLLAPKSLVATLLKPASLAGNPKGGSKKKPTRR